MLANVALELADGCDRLAWVDAHASVEAVGICRHPLRDDVVADREVGLDERRDDCDVDPRFVHLLYV